jgi:hypothetical protein
VPNGQLARGFNSRAIRETIAVGKSAGVAVLAFLASRRWLLAAVVVTCGLLFVFLTLAKPKQVVVFDEPDEPEIKFDEVTNLGAANSGGWFHRWTSEAANRVERTVPGLTLGTPPADDSEPPDATRITRRLDAVRSRQSKGAVLTGKIDALNTTARQNSNAPLRPPAEVLPKTVSRTSDPIEGMPESAFR